MADDLAWYRTHSRWSDPGRLTARLAELPAVPDAVVHAVSGLVLDPFLATMRGVALTPAALEDKDVRPVEAILERLLSRDGRRLTVPRSPEHRVLGACRHYAIMATAVFRTHAVPARARVGFGAYFTPGYLEDHWVCEYWDGAAWRLLDANLDEGAIASFGIAFAPCDVPRDQFIDAPTAWCRLRVGDLDPATMGVSAFGLAGPWFAAANVVRDVAALNKEELLPWDCWGAAREFCQGRAVSPDWMRELDDVAALLGGTPGAGVAQQVYRERAWLRLTPTVLSFVNGVPTEVPVETP